MDKNPSDYLGIAWKPVNHGMFTKPTADGSEIRQRYGKYPIIERILYIPGGCLGFSEPSTVCQTQKTPEKVPFWRKWIIFQVYHFWGANC